MSEEKDGETTASPVSVMKMMLSCPAPPAVPIAAVRPPAPATESRGCSQESSTCAATAAEATIAGVPVPMAASTQAESYQRRRRRSSRLSKEMAAEAALAKLTAEAAAARADVNTTAAGIRVKDMTRRREADDEALLERQLSRRERLRNLDEICRESSAKSQQVQNAWVAAAASVPRVTRAVTSQQIARMVEPVAAAEVHAQALAEKLVRPHQS